MSLVEGTHNAACNIVVLCCDGATGRIASGNGRRIALPHVAPSARAQHILQAYAAMGSRHLIAAAKAMN